MEKELIEFPVIIDDTNEVLTLFLNKETAARANQGIEINTINIFTKRERCYYNLESNFTDEEFLRSIINKYQQNILMDQKMQCLIVTQNQKQV